MGDEYVPPENAFLLRNLSLREKWRAAMHHNEDKAYDIADLVTAITNELGFTADFFAYITGEPADVFERQLGGAGALAGDNAGFLTVAAIEYCDAYALDARESLRLSVGYLRAYHGCLAGVLAKGSGIDAESVAAFTRGETELTDAECLRLAVFAEKLRSILGRTPRSAQN